MITSFIITLWKYIKDYLSTVKNEVDDSIIQNSEKQDTMSINSKESMMIHNSKNEPRDLKIVNSGVDF